MKKHTVLTYLLLFMYFSTHSMEQQILVHTSDNRQIPISQKTCNQFLRLCRMAQFKQKHRYDPACSLPTTVTAHAFILCNLALNTSENYPLKTFYASLTEQDQTLLLNASKTLECPTLMTGLMEIILPLEIINGHIKPHFNPKNMADAMREQLIQFNAIYTTSCYKIAEPSSPVMARDPYAGYIFYLAHEPKPNCWRATPINAITENGYLIKQTKDDKLHILL